MPSHNCTEFPIQQSFKTVQQQLTFLHYKNTKKSLVGIASSGGITFIPDLRCGSISNKEIFKRSKLPQILESGDSVLADKGFKIEVKKLSKNKYLEKGPRLTVKLYCYCKKKLLDEGVGTQNKQTRICGFSEGL